MEHAAELIKSAHEKGVLAMTTIGTSQEGADEATIRQIALMCKMQVRIFIISVTVVIWEWLCRKILRHTALQSVEKGILTAEWRCHL